MHIIYAREFSLLIQCEPGFRKTMDSSEDEGLFITQSSTKRDISAEIEGNVVKRLNISVSAYSLSTSKGGVSIFL